MNIGIVLLSLLIIYIIITIVELTGLYKFNLNYYDRGFKIYKREIKHTFSNWSDLDGIYYREEGNYVFLPESKIGYFITRYRFFRDRGMFWSYRTLPLTIFGRFEEMDELLEITYYISYRLICLISIWLLVLVVVPILAGNLWAILFGMAVVAITLLILYVVHTFQQGRMLLLSDEIAKILKIRNKSSFK